MALLYVLWIPTMLSASRAFAERPRAVLPIALGSVGVYAIAVALEALTR